jgi:hypothetical protein
MDMATSIERVGRPETARARPKRREAGTFTEWRERLLAELCTGREGARLRRLLRAHAISALIDERRRNNAPRRPEYLHLSSYQAWAVVTLRDLAIHRGVAPRRVARYEERIRFAHACVDELRHPDDGRIRLDRIVIALEILEAQLRCAEAFIDLATRASQLGRIA